MKDDKGGLLRQAALQIGSGGSAGFVEVCIMHPLDVVKTRLQIQKTPAIASDPKSYTGVLDCLKKMYRYEGLFSYYKGIIPPILAETPKRALKFFTFEQYKQFFMFGNSKPVPLTYSLAGLGAGVTEAIFVNPFEVVKVALQSNKDIKKEVPSTWQVARQIVKKDGLGFNGLNKGVTATIARNGVFNMFYFGFYHSVKDLLPTYEDPIKEFSKKVGIGFVSGTVASCLNIPFDVAKSRIQGPVVLVNGKLKYKSTIKSVILIYKEEGFMALYKGLVPKVLRLGPGGAIMLVVYDYMFEFLNNTL